MAVETKVAVAELPAPSTSFTGEPIFEHPGGDAFLRFEWRRGTHPIRGGLRFEKVRAYRFRAEGHCTAWHVEGAYDVLTEVLESQWVADLRAVDPAQTRGSWDIHHFMLYVDSAGCYEVASAAWSWLPEDVGP